MKSSSYSRTSSGAKQEVSFAERLGDKPPDNVTQEMLRERSRLQRKRESVFHRNKRSGTLNGRASWRECQIFNKG